MKKSALFYFLLAVLVWGCATVPPSALMCSPEVRRMSAADDRLFRDVFGGPGGVGFADRVMFPQARAKKITKIEVVVPYDNHHPGSERWTVEHDGRDSCAYLVKFLPDGHGGTTFSTQKDNDR